MQKATAERVATWVIWAFFLSIFTKILEVAAQKLGSPVRPVLIYAAICVVAGITAMIIARQSNLGWRSLTRGEIIYFLTFAALALLVLAGYRGENAGPDLGHPLIDPSEKPTALGYAIWPTLNFVMALSLFVFVRSLGLWRTILLTALVAFVAQVASMEVDMIWPATLGEANGRAAGFAKNANVAGMLVICLAVLFLPLRTAEPMSRRAVHVLWVAVAALLFSLSRGGWVILVAVLILLIAERLWSRAPSPLPTRSFAAAFVLVIGATLAASPIYRPMLPGFGTAPLVVSTPPVVSPGLTPPSVMLSPPGTTASAETVRIRERISSTMNLTNDASLQQRIDALRFFIPIALRNPLGLGTGFSNRYAIPPHNTAVKLAVDNGLLASALYLVLLGTMVFVAVQHRSPLLLALSAVGVIASQLQHTNFVEPQVFVLFAAALGPTGTETKTRWREPTPSERLRNTNGGAAG